MTAEQASQFRQSTLHASSNTWQLQASITAYLNWFRSRRATAIEMAIDAPLAAIYDLLESGYGLDVAISALTCLQIDELRTLANLEPHPDRPLALPTPIHYDEHRGVVHYLKLSPSLHPYLKRWSARRSKDRRSPSNKNTQESKGGHAEYAISDIDADTKSARFRAVRAQMETAHEKRWSDWLQVSGRPMRTPLGFTNETLPTRPPRLTAVAKSHINLALTSGDISPALSSALGSLPLPADPHPHGVQISTFWPPPYALRMAQGRCNTGRANRQSTTPIWDPERLTAATPPELRPEENDRWVQDAKAAIKSICSVITTEFTRKRLGNAAKEKLLGHTRDWSATYGDLLPPLSVPWLCILWVVHLLTAGRIAPQTARQYLSDVASQTLLHHPSARSLAQWDDEDIDTAFELIAEEPNLHDNTIKQRAARVLAFLQFTKNLGLLSDCHLPQIEGDYLAAHIRNRLVSPSDIDALLERLLPPARPETDAAALLILCGFYLGLRASEVLRLRLGDIDLPLANSNKATSPFLRVRQGKTPSARRKLPLDVLLPPHALAWMVKIIAQRRDQFPRNKRLAHIMLAGPAGDTNGFEYDDIAKFALGHVRATLEADLDLHSLRHNFATWWLVRWHRLRNPHLPPINNASHPLFSLEHGNRLEIYLSWGRQTDKPHHHFIELARLMGHSHFGVTRKTYAHAISFLTNE